MAALGLIEYASTLIWADRAVSRDLAPYVKSLTYVDSLRQGKSERDQVNLTLDNRKGIFTEAWFPSEGDILSPGVAWQHRRAAGMESHTWGWGSFEIDSIRFRFGPDEVVIGALATTAKRSAMETARSRAFENIQLSALVRQIAAEADMQSAFTGNDVLIERVEQRAESNRDFLARLADRYGLPIAQKNQSLYVGTPTLQRLVLSLKQRDIITQADFPLTKRDTYNAIVIDYYDAEQRKQITYRSGSPEASEGRTLRLYDVPVRSLEEAKLYADSQLSNGTGSGKQTAFGQLQLINTPVAAGQEIELKDAGKLPPIWKVVTQTTSLGGRWICNLKLERAS